MDTHLVETKSEWEALLAQRPEANFLQSWNWGVFHQQLGKKIFHFFSGVRKHAVEHEARDFLVVKPLEVRPF